MSEFCLPVTGEVEGEKRMDDSKKQRRATSNQSTPFKHVNSIQSQRRAARELEEEEEEEMTSTEREGHKRRM